MTTEEILTSDRSTISNPFPGLRAFSPEEKNIFFGRDGLSDTLLDKLQATRFVAVVGTSGSGKSSLVRAGLLPTLRCGFTDAGSDWHVAMFRPINNPIHHLAIALAQTGLFSRNSDKNGKPTEAVEETLRRSSFGLLELVRDARLSRYENLLIVADQFEELYRFEPSEEVEHPKDEASAFVRLLLEATSQTELPIYVILTMRSDYLGDSAQFWGLPEAINRGQYLIPRMDDDEKREAIEGPVRVFDAKISAALVNRLLNDVGDDPRQLPILQHALMRTWDYWKANRRDGEPIGIEHYDNPKVGGMKEALSIHADEAYNDLDTEQQKLAKKLFKRLTEKGVGKREGRLPATVGELAEVAEANEAEVIGVIDAFRQEGRSFLMPPPAKASAESAKLGEPKPLTTKTLIDISHESLISGWTKLSAWVEEEAISAKIYQRLIDFALMYPNDFMTHPQLGVTVKWRDDNKPNEAWAKRYRTECGKALDEYRERTRMGLSAEKPDWFPAWAEDHDTEFGIAMRYLDRSEQKTAVQKRAKRLRRRFAYIGLAAAAFIFFALASAASFWASSAENEKEHARAAEQTAKDATQQALVWKDKALTWQKQTDGYRQQAYDGYQKYFDLYNTANDLRRKFESSARDAKAAERKARASADRGERLEKINDLFLGGAEPEQILGALRDLHGIYKASRDTSREADTAVKIGNLFLNTPSLDSEKGLEYYKDALSISNAGGAKIGPSVFTDIGDQIIDSDLDNKEAVPYYERALKLLAGSKNLKATSEAQVKLAEAYGGENPAKAEKLLHDAIDLVKDANDPVVFGDALTAIARFYSDRKIGTAEDYYYQAEGAYRRSPTFEARLGEARALSGLATLLDRLGKRDEALSRYKIAVSLYESLTKMPDKGKDQQRSEAANEKRRAESRIRSLSVVVPIVDVLAQTLKNSGIEEAVKQYHDLKINKFNQYDFREDSVNTYGYVLLRANKVKEAIEIFKLNVEAYPGSYNTWDSLGEAYLIAGNKELAIFNYEKSVQLNPGNWRGVEALKKLKSP